MPEEERRKKETGDEGKKGKKIVVKGTHVRFSLDQPWGKHTEVHTGSIVHKTMK